MKDGAHNPIQARCVGMHTLHLAAMSAESMRESQWYGGRTRTWPIFLAPRLADGPEDAGDANTFDLVHGSEEEHWRLLREHPDGIHDPNAHRELHCVQRTELDTCPDGGGAIIRLFYRLDGQEYSTILTRIGHDVVAVSEGSKPSEGEDTLWAVAFDQDDRFVLQTTHQEPLYVSFDRYDHAHLTPHAEGQNWAVMLVPMTTPPPITSSGDGGVFGRWLNRYRPQACNTHVLSTIVATLAAVTALVAIVL